MIKHQILNRNEFIIHDVSKECVEDWTRSSKDPRIGKSLIGDQGDIADSIFGTNQAEIYPINLSARIVSGGAQRKMHFKAILSNKDRITMVYKEILNNVCRDALIDKKCVILLSINENEFRTRDLADFGYNPSSLSEFKWISEFYFGSWLPSQ